MKVIVEYFIFEALPFDSPSVAVRPIRPRLATLVLTWTYRVITDIRCGTSGTDHDGLRKPAVIGERKEFWVSRYDSTTAKRAGGAAVLNDTIVNCCH